MYLSLNYYGVLVTPAGDTSIKFYTLSGYAYAYKAEI